MKKQSDPQTEKRIADVIVNPVAGKGRALDILPKIMRQLAENGIEGHIRLTEKDTLASDDSRKISADAEFVVCCGGDGTLNGVMSEMITSEKRIPLLYVPVGTTNDFASTLHIPHSPSAIEKTIDDIGKRQNRTIATDAGMLNGKVFVYTASFGLFTKTSYSVPQPMKNAIGHAAYLLEGAKELKDIKKYQHLTITWKERTEDGRELVKSIEGDFLFGTVSNSTSLGGVMRLPKDRVDLSDGLFEILLIRRLTSISDLQKDVRMLLNGKYDGDSIIYAQSSFVSVHAEKELKWSVDGEYAGEYKETEIHNIPHATKILLPKKKILF